MLSLASRKAGGLVHLARVQDLEVVQLVSGVEQQVGIGGRRHSLAVIDGESIADVVAVVHEVEHERPVLVGMGPVEAGQGLHGGESGEGLVDVHGHQLGLIETGLELLGHHHQLVLVGIEPGSGLGLGEPVGLRLGQTFHLPGESHQHPDVVTVVVDVLAQRLPHVDRMGPGRTDHHRLGVPFHPVGDLVPEVLDDDLCPLSQVFGMQVDETGQCGAGLGCLVFGVFEERLLDVQVPVVGEVVGQHVLDEALLDGLAHRIQVEGLVLAVGAFHAEELQGPALGSGSEREERQVRLPTPCCHRLGQQRLRVGGIVFDVDFGSAQNPAEFLGCLAGLRRMGLVDDHRIVALRQRRDLVEQERELLQGRDDDPGLLPHQCLGELG